MKTEHGSWPCNASAQMSDLLYFRHSRMSLIENGYGGSEVHVVTVAVITFTTEMLGNTLKTVTIASIVQQGGDREDALRAAYSYDPLDTIDVEGLCDWSSMDSETLSAMMVEDPFAKDRRHDMACHFIWDGVINGRVRRLPEPPKEDQSAYAW